MVNLPKERGNILKLYKELVILVFGIIITIIGGFWVYQKMSDTHPTVDNVTPLPLVVSHQTDEPTKTPDKTSETTVDDKLPSYQDYLNSGGQSESGI